jgi:hypothetical protein
MSSGPANNYPLRDAKGNPITVEHDDGRRALDVEDIPVRRLLELLLVEVQELRRDLIATRGDR